MPQRVEKPAVALPAKVVTNNIQSSVIDVVGDHFCPQNSV
jgi:hypothetical protein